ncbi:MAG: hypothetical protein IID31_12790 [Planctomycetes bacterium]|nr:hypothetical protein [Planctomycetota bacterium]
MTTPPDIIGHDLLPNPGDDKRRSKKEEERRQQAIIDQIFAEANKLGIEVTTTGEIDPTAEPNPERAEKIKNETQPRLIEYSRAVEADSEIAETSDADGSTTRRVRTRTRTVTQLGVNLEVLNELTNLVTDIRGAVIKIGARILSKIGVPVGGGGDGGDDDGNQASHDEHGSSSS